MRIPLLFLVLWRNEIVESEDKDEDVGRALSDGSFDIFVISEDTWGLTNDDDNGSFDDNDDNCFSETDEVDSDGNGSSEADEVDNGSFKIDDDSSNDWLEDEGWS